MKSLAIIAAFAISIVSSAAAEGVDRKRTNKIAHKSSPKEQNIGSEQYDPYLDIADRKLADDMSMSMPAGGGDATDDKSG